jgi:peptidoglycan/LPS O-acetylase OafA/YrhL
MAIDQAPLKSLTSERRGIPSLDGLRAFSILAVILGHSAWATSAHLTGNSLYRSFANGGSGVAVFFVLSGFLITNILLKEFDRTGDISLRRFYFRRSMRIFPAFYLYLAVIGILWAIHRIPEEPRSFAISGLYLWSLIPNAHGYFLQHSWSLSIEEVFYLFWPLLLVTLHSRGFLLRAALGLMLAMPLVRLLFYFLWPALRGYEYYMVYGWLDTMMAGCLLALINQKPWFVHGKRRYLTPWTVGPMTVTAFYLLPELDRLLVSPYKGFTAFLVTPTVRALCIAGMMIYVVDHEHGLAGKLLNWKWVRRAGLISYSLYLWQQIFMSEQLHVLPYGYLYLLAAAIASYLLVEQPALKLRSWLERRPPSAGRTSPRPPVFP